MLKMFIFRIVAFLQPVPDTLSHSATKIPVRTNFLKNIIDENLQFSHCDGLFWNKSYPLLLPGRWNVTISYVYVTEILLLGHPFYKFLKQNLLYSSAEPPILKVNSSAILILDYFDRLFITYTFYVNKELVPFDSTISHALRF